MKEIKNYNIEEFVDFSVEFMSSAFRNNTYIEEVIFLRAHVLIEYALNCYLSTISNSGKVDFFKDNTPFSKKIFIAEEFGDLNMEVIEILKQLNKLRNKYAHHLKFDQQELDRLYTQIKNFSNISNLNTSRDDQIEFVGSISNLFGYISGYIFGIHYDKSQSN